MTYLGNRKVRCIDLCNLVERSPCEKDNECATRRRVSHGTACAMLLDRNASDFELLSIRIFQSNGSKVFGDVELLVKALALCSEMDVDIVSLSAVSSILSDSRYLYDITVELAKSAIIVSALDNARFVTVPTSYPHVLGVRSDVEGRLTPGGLAYCANDPYNANIFANCNYELLRELMFSPSNSFAVPVVVAYINSLLLQGHPKHRIKSMLRELELYPIADEPGDSASLHRDIPVILLSNHTNEMCCMMMDSLFDNHEVQSAALSVESGSYDVRIKEVSGAGCIQNDLDFVKRHYKTDVIFVIGNYQFLDSVKQNIDYDVEMMCQNDMQITILFDGKQMNEIADKVPDRIYDILTS